MNRRARDDGAAVVELALVLPVLLLLISGIIDFGRIYWEQSTVSGAAREGVRLVALGNTDGSAIAAAVDDASGASDLTVSVIQADGTTTVVETDGSVAAVALPVCTPGDEVAVLATNPYSFLTPLPDLANITGFNSIQGKAIMRCGG
jgi:Flp pilus assembly protein TadG